MNRLIGSLTEEQLETLQKVLRSEAGYHLNKVEAMDVGHSLLDLAIRSFEYLMKKQT